MKFSINQQIEEVTRELKMRSEVYPRRVSSGKMRQSEAEYFTERMEAVKRTLEWLRDHRVEVLAQAKGEEAESSYAKQLIDAKLEHAMTGKIRDEFTEAVDFENEWSLQNDRSPRVCHSYPAQIARSIHRYSSQVFP